MFRYLLNYVLLTYYLLVERTSLHSNRTSTTDRYSQHWQLSWSVVDHAGICQQGRTSQLSPDNIPIRCASTLGCSIHTNTTPHSHYSARWSQSQRFRFHKKAILSRRLGEVWRLAPRHARWVKQEWLYVCQPLSDCSLVLQMLPLSDPFSTVIYPRALATSVSTTAKHVRQFCKQKKNCSDWPSVRKPRPLKLQKSALGKCHVTNICIGYKSLLFTFTFLFRMQINITCWYIGHLSCTIRHHIFVLRRNV